RVLRHFSLVSCVLLFVSLSSAFAETHDSAPPKKVPATALRPVEPREQKGDGNVPPINVASNAFTVTRPLGFYIRRLGVDFIRDVSKLGKNGSIIDGGGGEGIAMEHLFQLGKNALAKSYTGGEAAKILDEM